MRTFLIIILVISALGILLMCCDMYLPIEELISCMVLLMFGSIAMDKLKL